LVTDSALKSDVTDQRLVAAKTALAAGSYKVLSLDIFDTLLWRRVPEPADMFLVLGNVLGDSGKLARHISPLAFADLRHAAERAAREKVQAVTGYREIALVDIYAALPDHIFSPGFDQAARLAAELMCERDLLVLDTDLVALMKAAKEAGSRVILVSDTYFTSAQIRDFLSHAGFKEEGLIDRLYASCEKGKPKYRDLFDDVLRDLDVTPAAMLHIGDTLEADINPCRARGIAVVHYDKWSFSPRVRAVEFPADRVKRGALLDGRGDYGLTGLRARLAHRPPVSLGQDLRPYWSYGAAVLAPVFAAFSRWIVEEARAAGAARVFGLMREGRFLKRVVEATAASLNMPMTVDELWLSRRAVVRAGLFEDDLGLLPEAILLSPGADLDQILHGLGLARADLQDALPERFDFRQSDALPVLVRAITATPLAKMKVLAASGALRANLLRGIGKTVDLSKGDAILLDLGYAATIQSVLANILAREKRTVKLTGFYFALNEKAMSNVRAGADLRAFLSDEGFLGVTGALLSRTPDVLEHACMCREGSLECYDDSAAPVLLPNQRDEGQLAQMEALQDGIMAGVAAVNALLGDLHRTPGNSPPLKGQIAQIVAGALLHPTPQEAATIGAWRHEANFDLTDKRRLTDLAFNPGELEYRGWPALQELGRHQVYWPAAAFVSANPFIAGAFAGGAAANYDATHLSSGSLLGGVIIAPDLGIGFDAKRQGAMPLAVNVFGRGDFQAIVKPFNAEAYRRLRFTWPRARAVVAIDSVAVSYIGENQRQNAVPVGLTWTNTTTLDAAGSQMSAVDKAAEAVLALDAAPAWPHAIEIAFRFKYLKLDPVFGGRS
jgi:FMN phosphatase YigB (HAD superfamily)